MSDSKTKFDEMEETKSYSGLGGWVETNTNKIMTKNSETKPILGKESKEIFRILLEEFRDWEESWRHYSNNSDILQRPIDAEQFSQELCKRYEIEEI